MNAYRFADFLQCCPEGVQVLVVIVAIFDGIRSDVKGGCPLAAGTVGFLDGQVRGLNWQHGGHQESIRCFAAVFETPVVIGAAAGSK